MDNVFASECSSGCESGWTHYLEHSFLNPNASYTGLGGENGGIFEENRRAKDVERGVEAEEEEEEDMSMVSDASSGPPHINDDNNDAYFNNCNGLFYPSSKAPTLSKTGKKRQKVKGKQCIDDQHLPSFLDDTASSPFFQHSMNNSTVANQQASMESAVDFSQGFSATYFEGRSAFQDHLGYLQPYIAENELQNKGWFGEKGMGMR